MDNNNQNDNALEADLELWLSSRPEPVKKAARRFPPGTTFKFDGEDTIDYIIGFTDDGGLLVSKTDPARNYEKAVKNKRTICKECLKDLMIVDR